MKFKYDYHQQVITILNALKTEFFLEISTFFGGGTLLTLLYNEYRLSKDIDLGAFPKSRTFFLALKGRQHK